MESIQQTIEHMRAAIESGQGLDADLSWLMRASVDEQTELLSGLVELLAGLELTSVDKKSPSVAHNSINKVLSAFREVVAKLPQAARGERKTGQWIGKIAELYPLVGDDSDAKATLLEILALLGNPAACRLFADLLVDDPPVDDKATDRAMLPLFSQPFRPADVLFPRLFNALSRPALATAVLDLSNYMTRSGCVEIHPAKPVSSKLAELLGQLAQGLENLDDAEGAGAAEAEVEDEEAKARQKRQQVGESIGLGVALCDALGLIGDRDHVGKLFQASEVPHRRLQVEAFGALARLDEPIGKQRLAEYAADPSMRLRAIQYARELELEESIDDRWLSSEARAEAELATWLADPHKYGIAPTSLTLYDSRELFWPGQSESQECFLFRFEYRFGEATYENLGFAGPSTLAFHNDLLDLSPFDAYAAFASATTSHPDVFMVQEKQLDESYQVDREKLEEQLHERGFHDPEMAGIGVFFGERIWVGDVVCGSQPGALAISLVDHAWFPYGSSQRPIDPLLAFEIQKGRRFLKTFNAEEDLTQARDKP